jgi:hypothetical protein
VSGGLQKRRRSTSSRIWVHITPTSTTPQRRTTTRSSWVWGPRADPRHGLPGRRMGAAVGLRSGVSHGAFALEKRAGGHVFQVNFSDSFATTAASSREAARAAREQTAATARTGTWDSTSRGSSTEDGVVQAFRPAFPTAGLKPCTTSSGRRPCDHG